MKLFKALWLVLLLMVGISLAAQTGEGEIENWIEAKTVCSTAAEWLLEVDVSTNVSEVYVFPDVSGAWVWFIGEAKTRRFWIDKLNDYVSLRVEVSGQGSYDAEIVILESDARCETATPEMVVSVNECLGMSLNDFVAMVHYTPLGDSFEVDGRSYLLHETLSFFVPLDAVWTWDLYVDGRHLLRFEQGERFVCHVSEVYAQ